MSVSAGLPRTDTIHLDPPARPFIAHRLGHLQHAAFRRRIRTDVDVGNERDDARHVDDLPGAVELEESATDFLCGDEAGFEIDGEDLT